MFGEENHCFELFCVFPHKAGIIGKHEDIPLIARIEKYWTPGTPIVSRYNVSLLEMILVYITEMIYLKLFNVQHLI